MINLIFNFFNFHDEMTYPHTTYAFEVGYIGPTSFSGLW